MNKNASISPSVTPAAQTRWLSAYRMRQLRLLSGLIISLFVLMHFLNHALGLISLELMETARRLIHVPIWQSLIGKSLLMSALLLHFILALQSLYRRSSLKIPGWELAQIGFGFSIPLLLTGHIIGAQVAPKIIGFELGYPLALDMIWTDGWILAKQLILIVVVWLHAMIGLHFWLRLKPWYRRYLPVLYALAVMLPLLAILGFIRAALEMQAILVEPGVYEQLHAGPLAADMAQKARLGMVVKLAPLVVLVIILLTLFARWFKIWHAYKQPRFIVHHPLAGAIKGLTGQSVLEALRSAGVPHAAVCGGRARCTTCRINVDRGLELLDPPTDMEAAALKRIKADSSVRLACQVRPKSDLWMTPLLPPKIGPSDYQGEGGISGNEQEVVAMFVDLRGFSSFAEDRLPYDVVLILNQFFGHMSAALASTRGHYAQFTGDGLFALFGLEGGIQQACRDALSSAVEMQCRLDNLNQAICRELNASLRIGIGIHCGEAIVGPMGPPDARVVSAIGDSVNVASRLETASKQFGCVVVVSQETVQRAGLELQNVTLQEIEIRGRHQKLSVYPVCKVEDIKTALDKAQ